MKRSFKLFALLLALVGLVACQKRLLCQGGVISYQETSDDVFSDYDGAFPFKGVAPPVLDVSKPDKISRPKGLLPDSLTRHRK